MGFCISQDQNHFMRDTMKKSEIIFLRILASSSSLSMMKHTVANHLGSPICKIEIENGQGENYAR